MKRTIFVILMLMFFIANSKAQRYSLAIDSLSKVYIGKLPQKHRMWFDSILIQRSMSDLFMRIDTTTFDYGFIQENYCYSDSIGTITERYFLHNDTIPKYIYEDGYPENPISVYDGRSWWSENITRYNTLHPLLQKYRRLKPIQQLVYDRVQIWEHGCVIFENSEEDFKKERTVQLMSTYQIQTMVDKKENRLVVSIQKAPLRPKFKIHSYNPVWAW